MLRSALVIAVVGASARPVVDLASPRWRGSRRLAPSRRRLAFRAALLADAGFDSVALVVEALELAAERFGVLTFVDVNGCCALRRWLRVAALGAEIALLSERLFWGFYAPSAMRSSALQAARGQFNLF